MIRRRLSAERGHRDHGWLDTYHTFSFGEYHDPDHMGFRLLQVINEDRVKPSQGFDTHAHWDMEIVTVVLSGALEHRDSLGNGCVIHGGDVQCMTAGTGVEHSEFNRSDSELVHFLQIWIVPDRRGLHPSYEQRTFPPEGKRGRLRLVVSPEGRDDSVGIHQDIAMFDCHLEPGEELSHSFAAGRHAWIQMTAGEVEANGTRLAAGDGAAVSDEREVRMRAASPAELLLLDLA